MDAPACFAADYQAARAKFLDAARQAGARIESHPAPVRGPDGGELATDVAVLGPPDAPARLVTFSATHGGEGFAGSGIQVGSLRSGMAMPDGVSRILVHGVNPYGFAWLRRVTEENVDLNRNFVDFAAPLPGNDDYDALADAIAPPRWNDPEAKAAADARLRAFAASRGTGPLQQAVTGGQWRHADGIFYGGAAPTATRRRIERILDVHCAGADRIALIDYHTGLGPRGHGEMIVMHRPETPGWQRAKSWWGEAIVSPFLGNSASAEVRGDALQGFAARFAARQVEYTGMALEYGTLDYMTVFESLRADNWLHAHGDPAGPEAVAIKRLVRDAFYCDADDWKAAVLAQGLAAERAALAGLAA